MPDETTPSTPAPESTAEPVTVPAAPIKVGFNKEEPMSFDAAANLVAEKASKTDREVRDEVLKGELPINTASADDMNQFLTYALSICEQRSRPEFIALLKLKIGLATHPKFRMMSNAAHNDIIAKNLTHVFGRRVFPFEIEKLEKDAIKFVQDEIIRTRATGIPIVGGKRRPMLL